MKHFEKINHIATPRRQWYFYGNGIDWKNCRKLMKNQFITRSCNAGQAALLWKRKKKTVGHSRFLLLVRFRHHSCGSSAGILRHGVFELKHRRWRVRSGSIAISVSSSATLSWLTIAKATKVRRPHEKENRCQNRPHHGHHEEPAVCRVAVRGSRKAILDALIVGAVGLGLPQERQEPSHGHLMVEDAFARIKTVVTHDCSLISRQKIQT